MIKKKNYIFNFHSSQSTLIDDTTKNSTNYVIILHDIRLVTMLTSVTFPSYFPCEVRSTIYVDNKVA